MFLQIIARRRYNHGHLYGTNPTTQKCSTLNQTSEAPHSVAPSSECVKELAKSTRKWLSSTPTTTMLQITQTFNPDLTNAPPQPTLTGEYRTNSCSYENIGKGRMPPGVGLSSELGEQPSFPKTRYTNLRQEQLDRQQSPTQHKRKNGYIR